MTKKTTIVTENPWYQDPDSWEARFGTMAKGVAQTMVEQGTTHCWSLLNIGIDLWLLDALQDLGVSTHVISPWAGYGRALAHRYPALLKKVNANLSSWERGSQMMASENKHQIHHRRRLAYFTALSHSDACIVVSPSTRLDAMNYRVRREASRLELPLSFFHYDPVPVPTDARTLP